MTIHARDFFLRSLLPSLRNYRIACLDGDGGELVQDDLQFYLYEVCHWHFTDREWNTLWTTIDVDHSNSIDREEFEETLFWATRHERERELLKQQQEESQRLGSQSVACRRKNLKAGASTAFGSLGAVRECFGEKWVVCGANKRGTGSSNE